MPVPHRSDARRNRAEILRVADEEFTAERGPVRMKRIARLAGVAPATVYRHFPDRRALAVGVIEQQLVEISALVADRGEEPEAFRGLLRLVMERQASRRPLVALAQQMPPWQQQAYITGITRIMAGPFQRAREAGLLRRDAEPADIALTLTMLEATIGLVADQPDYPRTARRAINLLLDGVCAPDRRPVTPSW